MRVGGMAGVAANSAVPYLALGLVGGCTFIAYGYLLSFAINTIIECHEWVSATRRARLSMVYIQIIAPTHLVGGTHPPRSSLDRTHSLALDRTHSPRSPTSSTRSTPWPVQPPQNRVLTLAARALNGKGQPLVYRCGKSTQRVAC